MPNVPEHLALIVYLEHSLLKKKLLIKSTSLPSYKNPESALSHRQTSLKNFLTAQSPQAPCIQYGSVEFRKCINNYIRFNERFIGKLKKLPLLNVSKTVLASKLQLVYCCVLICDTNLHFKCSCAVVSGSFRLVFIVKVKFYKITIKQSADYYSD